MTLWTEPRDIRYDHPLFEDLVDQQVRAVVRQDHRYLEYVEDQLRDFVDDPAGVIQAMEQTEAAMKEAAHDY